MDILKSLTQVSTDYSFFEENQVLTHNQLNSITGYLDDQNRLTRVNLLGVGIACGLRVLLQGDTVKVSKGVGATTDGDLLYFNNEMVFDKFKLYDASNPKYAPFYVGEKIITLYELVRTGKKDERAASLSKFDDIQTKKTLGNMVAVLFMESYKTDRDICSGTDCDNLGQDCINNIKLLLVDKESLAKAERLKQSIITPHQAFGKLNEVAVVRPLITSSDNSFSLIASKYRSSCTAIYKKLINELANLYRYCSGFTGDIFASDPAVDWKTKLFKLNTAFESLDGGIQYYYDFLKDVAETYNHFRELLFGDETWCCPDLEAFSKHLLLGNLAPGTDPEENRTGFYPSPLVSRTYAEQLKHAKFLLQKIDALIQTFKVPDSGSEDIRITPSMFEDQSLEERAIPYYYQMDKAKPVNKFWNYRLHQRGMDASNYSYNAAMYGGEAKPLELQIGRFSFFRIEGHMGKNVSTALSAIESKIKSKNLSFAVRSVLLGKDKTKVVKNPGIRYTDLHRFHYMLRKDVFHQLDDVMQFNDNFKKDVTDAVDKQIVNNTSDANDGPTVIDIVNGKHSMVAAGAKDARDKLDRSYSRYKTDITWIKDLKATMQAAGEFKYGISNVVKTEFPTPFDTLISNTHTQWLNWLDEIITKKDDKEDEKLLFSNFRIQHPGLEHCAGVVRGGTFVLVYDDNNRVVADFMLPYYCCDITEEETEEPALQKPGLRPDLILSKGISVLPSRNKFIKDKLDNFQTKQLDVFVKSKLDTFKEAHVDTLKNSLDSKFEVQKKEYFTEVKDSLHLMGNALTGKKGIAVEGPVLGDYKDFVLKQNVKDINEQRQAADYLRKKADQPDLPEDKKKMYEDAAKDAEMELADTVTKAAKYVAEEGLDMSLGSEGMAAMMEMNKGFEAIKDAQALEAATTSLEKVKETSKNTGLNMAMGNMLGRRR